MTVKNFLPSEIYAGRDLCRAQFMQGAIYAGAICAGAICAGRCPAPR